MGYCSISDLNTYGMPSTAFGDDITDPMKQAAIDATAAEMDTYLRPAYPLPLASVPLELVACNAVLAVEMILRVRGVLGQGDLDSVVAGAQQQRDWLARVQRGAAKLNVPAPASGSTYSSPKAISSSTLSPQSDVTGSSRGW